MFIYMSNHLSMSQFLTIYLTNNDLCSGQSIPGTHSAEQQCLAEIERRESVELVGIDWILVCKKLFWYGLYGKNVVVLLSRRGKDRPKRRGEMVMRDLCCNNSRVANSRMYHSPHAHGTGSGQQFSKRVEIVVRSMFHSPQAHGTGSGQQHGFLKWQVLLIEH